MTATVEETFTDADVLTIDIEESVDEIATLDPRVSCSPLDVSGIQRLPTRTRPTSGIMKFTWDPVGSFAEVTSARFNIGDRRVVMSLSSTPVLLVPEDRLEITVYLRHIT